MGEIRGMVGSRRHNIGVTPHETLIDIVVHGQDIAIATSRVLEVPPTVAAAAASRVWASRKSFTSNVFRTLPDEGHRLTATDIDWSVSEGPEIRGPVLTLLLLLTGRSVAISSLEGEGRADLVAATQDRTMSRNCQEEP